MEIFWGIVGLIGTIITTWSLVFAIKTNKEKQRLEQLVKGMLAGIAGNIWHSRLSAKWADRNFNRARDAAFLLSEGEQKREVLKHIHNGARDAAAAKRMLSNLLGEVLSMQRGMFKTDSIVHPEMTETMVSKRTEAQDVENEVLA